MFPPGCQIAGVSFPPLDVSLSAQKMPLQTPWSSPAGRLKNAHRSPDVSPTLRSARRSGWGKKKTEGISFPPSPCRLIIDLAYLCVHPDSPPPAGAWIGLDDTRRIPRLLKGSRHGGGGSLYRNSYYYAPKGLIYERDCGLCAAACGLCITQVCTHSMQNDRWWRWNVFWYKRTLELHKYATACLDQWLWSANVA